MKLKNLLLLLLFAVQTTAFAQIRPMINITYSRLFCTYDFLKKLTDGYPDNIYKEKFKSSPYNTPRFKDLIRQLDTMQLYYSFDFPDYPPGQKSSVATSSILERNLIYGTTITEFKKQSFGIIPSNDLLALAHIIDTFASVYDSLVYRPHQQAFEKKLKDLDAFVQKTQLAQYFEKGLTFYGTSWDHAVPIDIAIIPSIEDGGFTGTAFLNNAVSEVPLNFNDNDVLFSVLMHEIYHTIYNEQPFSFKQELKGYFNSNPAPTSQYAYLLLNEVLATALGNGYVYEQINGKADTDDWYNVKYISQMAKKIYPTLKQYLASGKRIDKAFVDTYIYLYDPSWMQEAKHLFTYRYVLTDELKDFTYFRKNYRYSSIYEHESGIGPGSLDKMTQKPLTKVIIVSKDHAQKLRWIKQAFPELKSWNYNPAKEFTHTLLLKDYTLLFIINKRTSTTGQLLESALKSLPKP